MKLRGRCISAGRAKGRAIVTHIPFSFKGEIDPKTGMVPSPSHELFGQSLKGKVLVCPTGKGSSEGSNLAYEAMRNGVAPVAIIMRQVEPVLAAAVLIAKIPAVDEVDIEFISPGDLVRVDASKGIVEVRK